MLALLAARLLSPRRRVGVCAASLSAGGALLAWHHVWFDAPWDATLTHIGAAGAVFWVLAARLFRLAGAPMSARPLVKYAPEAFDRVAVLCGVAAFVPLLFEMTVVGLLRTGLRAGTSRLYETSPAGLADLAGLVLAIGLSSRVATLVTPLFWVLAAIVVWSGLMIPAGLSSKWIVTDWPRWMPWTLWIFVGMSLILFGFTMAQGMHRQRLRKRAWPNHLERLCEPHARWPGFRPSAAAVAMGLLPLGAYHADSFWVMPCAALAGGAALRLAHRAWNTNFADVGLALVTLSVTSFIVACVPDWVGGPELTTRMPILLAAAMIGLAVMIFILQWLPSVWDQQLRDGVPWTTTGRMIALTRRIGVVVASFGALASMQLAFWPEIAVINDHSPPRIALGLSANLLMIGSMVVAARMSKRRSMAGIVLLSLALAGVYVAVRLPPSTLRSRLIEHWPIEIALLSPVTLGLMRWARRDAWRMFEGVLEFSAVAIFPGIAIGGTIATSLDPVATLRGKLIYYDPEFLRTATWGILAAYYALHAAWLRERSLWVPAVALAAGAVVNQILFG